MEKIRLMSNRDYESLMPEEKKQYLENIRQKLQQQGYHTNTNIGHELITTIYPFLRGYQFEIIGEENIPEDDSVIFMCNHSNSHDYFTAHEVFSMVGRSISVFAAKDGINPIVKTIFGISDATLIDRRDKESTNKGTLEFSKKIMEGKCGVIFGEATWNLHPIKPMQSLKIGGARIGAITRKKIIPTIFEYVEIDEKCEKEKDLYSKCIIYFGKPIEIIYDQNLVEQTMYIQKVMEKMRMELWKKIGIRRENIEDINPELYINHTYVKKFKAFGYEYDTESENKFLYSSNNEKVENEFCIDEFGNFVPGIVKRKK